MWVIMNCLKNILKNFLTAYKSTLCQISLYKAIIFSGGTRGDVVFKAPRYKPAGRGFDSRCCHWNFSGTKSFRSHFYLGVDSASNRNEYHVHFLGVKAVGA